MGSKKTTKQTSSSTQTNAPPSWTAPGLQEVASRVTAGLDQIPSTGYQGDFIAQPDGALVEQIAKAYQDSAALAAQMGGKVNLAGYDMGANAQTSGVIDAALHPVMRNLTENILPSIRSSSLDSGAYSGSRAMTTLPGQAIRDTNEAGQRLAAEISYKDYQDRENRRLQAYGIDQGNMPALMDTVMRMSASEGDLLAQAMGIKQAAGQNFIDNNLARDNYDLAQPFRGLDIATALLSQLSGNYGTQTGQSQSKTVEKTGGLGSVVQGLAGIAGMVAGGMSGLGGVGGLLGSAASAAASPVMNPAALTRAFSGLGGASGMFK